MNTLSHSKSLYLQQHAHNPVHWQMWGEKAFEKAKQEDKPVLISIGYAACHWCHVMERESFENEEVARFMNEHFVCIKVDREEHPVVDHMYMDALQIMNNRGGWPLNMFVTPDKKPFYGGTYFPPRAAYGMKSWMEILSVIHQLWINERGQLLDMSEQVMGYLDATNERPNVQENITYDFEQINNILLSQRDLELGGFRSAPKFPECVLYRYFLVDYYLTKNEEQLEFIKFTIDKMLKSGIYDAVNGGLFRYSTDNEWKVPHFEKMLYDQAMFLMILTDLYKITKQNHYKKAIEQTLDFCFRELMEEGLFISSLDADSEGVEGKFYTYTYEELSGILGEENKIFEELFHLKKEGNWEDVNIIHQAVDEDVLWNKYQISKDEFTEKKSKFLEQLNTIRKNKKRPSADKKQLLSWNALMNSAIVQAANALQNQDLMEKAIDHLHKMELKFSNKDSLLHIEYGVYSIMANADDWAFLIATYCEMGNAKADKDYYQKAYDLYRKYEKNFSAKDGIMFHLQNSNHRDLPIDNIEIRDAPIPSSNAVIAGCILKIGLVFNDFELIERSKLMNKKMKMEVESFPAAYAYWMINERLSEDTASLSISGRDSEKYASSINNKYLPQYFIKEINDEEAEGILICKAGYCEPLIENVSAWLEINC